MAASVNIAALETVGWFTAAEHRITPLVERRNIAMAATFKRSALLNTHRLHEARRLLKSAVSTAKNDWTVQQCNAMNDGAAGQRGTAVCWDTLSVLRRGLSKCCPSAERSMKKPERKMPRYSVIMSRSCMAAHRYSMNQLLNSYNNNLLLSIVTMYHPMMK